MSHWGKSRMSTLKIVLGALLPALVLGLAACSSDQFIVPPPEASMMMAEDAMMDEEMDGDSMMMAMDAECMATVTVDGARLRTGPGTDYPVYGLAYEGDGLGAEAMDAMADAEWTAVILDTGARVWIASELVETDCP